MFILLFLNIGKKSWQFFVLLLYFLCESLLYFFLFYLIWFILKKIIFIFLFSFYFIYNVLAIYLNFYFYVANVFFDFFKFLIFLDIHQRNVFGIFLLLSIYLFSIKTFTYIFIFMMRKAYKYFFNFFKIYFNDNYKKVTASIFFFWLYLTKFLRIKHYKAVIFFIYVCYITIVINLLCMNFNP